MAACHACGAAYDATDRVGFRDVCAHCDADLHVCLNCRFHDPAASNACRETQAEVVVDKDRANRCEWFQPGEGGRGAGGRGEDAGRARERLEALFRKPGEGPGKEGTERDPRAAAEDLFKKKR